MVSLVRQESFLSYLLMNLGYPANILWYTIGAEQKPVNIYCMALASTRSFILGEENRWTVQTKRKKKTLSAAQCNRNMYTLVCRYSHLDKWTHNTHLPSRSRCEFYLITPLVSQ